MDNVDLVAEFQSTVTETAWGSNLSVQLHSFEGLVITSVCPYCPCLLSCGSPADLPESLLGPPWLLSI